MPKEKELEQKEPIEGTKLDVQDDLKGDEKKVVLPEEFKDSKPEDLVKIIEDQKTALAEKDDQIGSIDKRFTEFEKRQGYLEGLATQLTKPAKPKEEPKVEFDIENPMASIDKVVESKLGKKEEETNKKEYNQSFFRSKAAYDDGYQHMEGNALFEGIEEEVANRVGSYHFKFVGDPMVESSLRNRETWIKAGQAVRLERKEYDKVDPGHIEPISARGGARPSESRQDRGDEFDASIDTNDPATQQWLKTHGLTVDDAQKIIADEAEEQANEEF